MQKETMDAIATEMVRIGKVTKVPSLAESAILAQTIIDIVTNMKKTKKKFQGLARTTAYAVSATYRVEEMGCNDILEGQLAELLQVPSGKLLQVQSAEVHSQLIEIARFVREKRDTGEANRLTTLIGLVQKKPDDAISEYEQRLERTLRVAENMRRQQQDVLDRDREKALEREQAAFEEHRKLLVQLKPEWSAKRNAAEPLDQANKEQGEGEEAEARNREHEAGLREQREWEKELQGEDLLAERLMRARKEAWLIAMQKQEANKPVEREYQREDEALTRTREEQEIRRREQEERSYQINPDRGRRTKDEDLSATTSNLQLSDSEGPPPRPRSWNPPSQHGPEDYGSSQAPRKNPYNNLGGSPPDIPRTDDGSRDSFVDSSSEALHPLDGKSSLQIDETKAEEKMKPFNIVSAIKSEIICAEEVAGFLHTERDSICNALNQQLSVLGYTGDFILQAGFNESLLHQGIEHPEVFLILNGSLEDDDVAISRLLSPIFSPHATVLYMESRVLNLIPPNELKSPLSFQESSAAAAPIHQLNSSNQSQSIKTIGSEQSDEQGDRGSTGNPPRDNEDEGKHPNEERDEEKQMDKGKGKATEGDEVPDHYRRQLELRLRTSLIIDGAASKESGGRSHEFNLDTKIYIKLRSNRGGKDWNELATGAQSPPQDPPQDLPQDPLCSVTFDKITTSRGGAALHSLTALMVHLEATPSQTVCEELSPKPNRYTDIKISNEVRTKGGGSATLGAKPEVKFELACEKGAREESTRPAWTIRRHQMSKRNPENAHVVELEYSLNGSEEVPDEEFRPGPSAIFSYESDQTDRSLRISVRAFWSLRLDMDRLKNRFKQFFKLTDNPPHLIYDNFFHKFSFSVDLRDLMQKGTDDDLLRGKNVLVEDDRIQDCRDAKNNKFETMPIQITRDGKDAIIIVPLQRAVISAIRTARTGRDRWEEGEQLVTSPE